MVYMEGYTKDKGKLRVLRLNSLFAVSGKIYLLFEVSNLFAFLTATNFLDEM